MGNTDILHELLTLMNMEQSNYGWQAASPVLAHGGTDFKSLSGNLDDVTVCASGGLGVVTQLSNYNWTYS